MTNACKRVNLLFFIYPSLSGGAGGSDACTDIALVLSLPLSPQPKERPREEPSSLIGRSLHRDSHRQTHTWIDADFDSQQEPCIHSASASSFATSFTAGKEALHRQTSAHRQLSSRGLDDVCPPPRSSGLFSSSPLWEIRLSTGLPTFTLNLSGHVDTQSYGRDL